MTTTLMDHTPSPGSGEGVFVCTDAVRALAHAPGLAPR